MTVANVGMNKIIDSWKKKKVWKSPYLTSYTVQELESSELNNANVQRGGKVCFLLIGRQGGLKSMKVFTDCVCMCPDLGRMLSGTHRSESVLRDELV